MADSHSPNLTLEDLRAYREEILALAERYGAYDVRVFGSLARGEATASSDVDLLVRFREGASLFELSGFWQDLEALLGRSVDIVEEHPQIQEHFRQQALQDAVSL